MRCWAPAARARRTCGGADDYCAGTDGASANDNLVLHEAMRAIAVNHRAGESDRSRWITARDASTWRLARAAALRQPDLGAIAPGFAADLGSTGSMPLVGPAQQSGQPAGLRRNRRQR